MPKASCLTILYASQTGTAEDLAYQLHESLDQIALEHEIMNINDYPIHELPEEQFLILLVSTTGDGEVPSTMKQFWRLLLRKQLSSDSLSELKFAIFGLGDSSYSYFNSAARKLNNRLKQLGGKEVLSVGLGDNQAKYGYLSAWNVWLTSLVTKLQSDEFSNFRTNTNHQIVNKNEYTMEYIDSTKSLDNNQQNDGIKKGTIVENIRLSSVSWEQDVRHIIINTSLDDIKNPQYETGDVVEIYYMNSKTLVDRILQMFQTEGDKSISIQRNSCKSSRPRRIQPGIYTIYNIFQRYLDIGGPPTRSFFKELSKCSTQNEERDKLIELSSAEGTDLFYDYCIYEFRNYVDILEDFKFSRPSLSKLLEIIPIIQPRPYSIASASEVYHDQIHLCVAILKLKTKFSKKMKYGRCTGYLMSSEVGSNIFYRINKDGAISTGLKKNKISMMMPMESFTASQMIPWKANLIQSLSTSLLLIGPGTGVAPMRAIIQMRLYHQRLAYSTTTTERKLTATDGMTELNYETLLFFGCRKKECDYLYGKSEWDVINQGGCPYERILHHIEKGQDRTGNIKIDATFITSKVGIITAFSQDQMIKHYVTHQLSSYEEVVWQLIKAGGCIFIAGSAKSMPKDVRKVILDIISKHLALDISIDSTAPSDSDSFHNNIRIQAEAYLNAMIRTG